MDKERKKVILCYPALNRFRWEREYHWFPFSITPIAIALANHGYEAVVIDYRVMPNAARDLRRHLKDAFMLGISTMSGYQIAGGLRIAKIAREVRPDLPIVWGGWHPTILPSETAEHPLVDIVVAGNGEQTIVKLADAISAGQGIEGIQGIAHKNGNGSVVFGGYVAKQDVQDDAQRYGDFLNLQQYVNPETKAAGYFSAHGCPFTCSFCSRHFMTRRYSTDPMEKVKEDIAYFINHGFRKINFQDDTFFVNHDRVMQIAEILLSFNLPLKWWANARVNVMDKFNKEERDLLVRSGLDTLFIGVESASPRLLELMTKGTEEADIVTTNLIMKEYPSVNLHLSYMFGIPSETIEDCRMNIEQIQLLKEQNPRVRVQRCFYQPYPGTELYQQALEWGYPKITDLEEWGRIQTQNEVNRIPWFNDTEMKLYMEEFCALENQRLV